MDPEHHWQMRVGSRIGRTCDVEVQAVELGLLKRLVGDAVLRKVEQLLLDALEARLRAYRAREQTSVRLAPKQGKLCIV